jgi:hypothetical protein
MNTFHTLIFLSKIPENKTPPSFPTGPLWRYLWAPVEIPVYRAFASLWKPQKFL